MDEWVTFQVKNGDDKYKLENKRESLPYKQIEVFLNLCQTFFTFLVQNKIYNVLAIFYKNNIFVF